MLLCGFLLTRQEGDVCTGTDTGVFSYIWGCKESFDSTEACLPTGLIREFELVLASTLSSL
eukprot:220018-Amphidinium_carterae.1